MVRTVILFFVMAGVSFASVPDPNEAVRLTLQRELGDFSVPGWDRRTENWPRPGNLSPFVPPAGPGVETYRARLVKNGSWPAGPVWHQMGTIPLVRPGHPDERLGVNVFFPREKSKGTLLFVHGYLSHAANFAYTFGFFTARGWTVVTLDLPGHGFSTGPRGDIDDFAGYGDAVATWMAWVSSQHWPGPVVLGAHSLGTAACFDALRRPGAPRPDRVVFFAPLLRPAYAPFVTLARITVGWAFEEVPTTFGWDGYLDGYQIPVHWFEALDRWLGTLDSQVPEKLPLTIYSGDQDTVVDAVGNRELYEKLVPGVRWVTFPGEGHLFLSDDSSRESANLRMYRDLGLDGQD